MVSIKPGLNDKGDVVTLSLDRSQSISVAPGSHDLSKPIPQSASETTPKWPDQGRLVVPLRIYGQASPDVEWFDLLLHLPNPADRWGNE